MFWKCCLWLVESVSLPDPLADRIATRRRSRGEEHKTDESYGLFPDTKGAIHSTKIQTGPTGKRGPPQKVDQFFRNFSGWTKPILWVLDGNFRKFWLNGSRPKFLHVCSWWLWIGDHTSNERDIFNFSPGYKQNSEKHTLKLFSQAKWPNFTTGIPSSRNEKKRWKVIRTA